MMKSSSLFLASALLASALLASAAADKPEKLKPLVSGSSLQVPAAGITINGLRDMKLVPQPRPEARHWTSGDKKVDAYPMLELWKRENLLAEYAVDSRASLRFWTLAQLPPAPSPEAFGEMSEGKLYVIDSEFRGKLRPVVTEADRAEWCTLAFGALPAASIFAKFKPVYPCEHFDLGNGHHVFLVSKDAGHFAIDMTVDPDDKKAEDLVLGMIKSLALRTPVASKAPAVAAPKKGASSELQASIDAVVAEIKNQTGWWCLADGDYVIKTNLNPNLKRFPQEILTRCQDLRSYYSRVFPSYVPLKAASVCTVPATSKEFDQYTNDDTLKNAAGLWIPGRKELVIRSEDSRPDAKAKKDLMETVNHEAFHQYLHYALNQEETPTWINEGHATLFENIRLKSRGTIDFLPSTRKEFFFRHQSQIDIKQIIAMPHAEFYKNPDVNYPAVWALCYFLRFGGPLYPDKNYEKVCDRIFTACANGKSEQEANQIGFDGIDMDVLVKDFNAFWKDPKKQAKAEKTDLSKRAYLKEHKMLPSSETSPSSNAKSKGS